MATYGVNSPSRAWFFCPDDSSRIEFREWGRGCVSRHRMCIGIGSCELAVLVRRSRGEEGRYFMEGVLILPNLRVPHTISYQFSVDHPLFTLGEGEIQRTLCNNRNKYVFCTLLRSAWLYRKLKHMTRRA